MEFFQRAKVFRLKSSHQSKYLTADQDDETVRQSRDSSSPNARWSFELVEGKSNLIRLRSCRSWKFLAASDEQFLLGMTGKRVAQRPWLGPTVEWEPIKEGPYIKLKSHGGTFLRANRGPPPWRNTITHDVAGHWTVSDSMIMWIVDIIEIDRDLNNCDFESKEEIKRNSNSVSCFASNGIDQNCFSRTSDLSNVDGDDDLAVNASSFVENSASFNNLKSMLASLDSINDDNTEEERTASETEVKMARRTFEELKNMEFHAIISLGRYNELNHVINMLINNIHDLEFNDLQHKLETMKNDHDSATQDLADYAAFDRNRLKTKTELDKDLAKACVLEATLEKWYGNEYVNASAAKREELIQEFKEIDSSLKAVEVLKSRIENKTKIIEDIEAHEESWLERKIEAERKLIKVEEDWVKVLKRLVQN